MLLSFFFFTAPAPTEIYTLSLHDALPIFRPARLGRQVPYVVGQHIADALAPRPVAQRRQRDAGDVQPAGLRVRSEEHTSELQSLTNLVCRLLLEKKKKTDTTTMNRERTKT